MGAGKTKYHRSANSHDIRRRPHRTDKARRYSLRGDTRQAGALRAPHCLGAPSLARSSEITSHCARKQPAWCLFRSITVMGSLAGNIVA